MRDGGEAPVDAEVVQRCLRGEVELFRVLVERHQDRVYHLALHLLGHPEDALDAAQETFVRAYGALARFDTARPLRPWLLRIAANVCYGMLRKRPAGQLSLDAMTEREADAAWLRSRGPADRLCPPAGAPDSPAVDPGALVTRAAEDEEVRRAVFALPEPYRTVTLLHYMEEMSYEAIAAALEIPLGTVKTHLHRARARLKKLLTAPQDRHEA